MNKNKVKTLIVFVTGLLVGLCINYNGNQSKVFEDESIKISKNFVAMMVETEAGTGEYTQSNSNEWLTDGYSFNSVLSGCENGGLLSWDDTNKKIIMESNTTEKCYVYFDIYVEQVKTLSNYVISQYTGTQGENGLYYHDSTLTNGAKDNSYRYSGADPYNYICFGSDENTCPTDNLYRIIGIFDGRIKIIKADYAISNLLGNNGDYYGVYSYNTTTYKGSLSVATVSTYRWNYNANNTTSNTWSTSLLNKTNLNTNYLNNIGSKWANMIDTVSWKVGGNTSENIYDVTPSVAYQNEIVNPVSTNSSDNATEYSAKIGLMYASDYGFAANPVAWSKTLTNFNSALISAENWLYIGLNEWIISRNALNEHVTFLIDNSGRITNNFVSADYCIRPTFYLNSSINYSSGDGTKTNPIRITSE